MHERRQKILLSKEYKMGRKEAINKVSIVLQRMIEGFHQKLQFNEEQEYSQEMNLASLLFNEQIFLDMPKQTSNQTSISFYFGIKKRQKGLSKITKPSALQVSLFAYAQKAIETFINKIFQKMRLTNEVCLLSFIFIERIIVSKNNSHSLEIR